MMNNLRAVALRLLAQRDYSEYLLRQKLRLWFFKQKYKTRFSPCSDEDGVFSVEFDSGISPFQSEIDSVIAYCYDYHYLDDIGYAKKFIVMRSQRGYGLNYIKKELAQKGVSGEDLAYAIASCSVDFSVIVEKIMGKKFANVVPSDNNTRQKIEHYLYARGFCREDWSAFLWP